MNDGVKRLARDDVALIADLFNWKPLAHLHSPRHGASERRAKPWGERPPCRAGVPSQSTVNPFGTNSRLDLSLGGGSALTRDTGLFKVAARKGYAVLQDHVILVTLPRREGLHKATPATGRLEAELRSQKIYYDVKAYADAGHGFINRASNAIIGAVG